MSRKLPVRRSRRFRRWLSREPLAALREEMNELFDRFFSGWEQERQTSLIPPVDVSETEDALQVRMDIPGMRADDLSVELSGNLLRVSGERQEEHEEKRKTFYRCERRIGSFARAVMLPCEVDEDNAKAEYADGVLTITLPKTEASRSRRIPVSAS